MAKHKGYGMFMGQEKEPPSRGGKGGRGKSPAPHSHGRKHGRHKRSK